METILKRFYDDDANSIFVQSYDAFYSPKMPQTPVGDIDFYAGIAREASGNVLELACGTGRVALPLAELGFNVTGVDLSEGLLSIAERKAAGLPIAAQQRLRFVQQDMRDLELGELFEVVLVPFHSFQYLLTSDLQIRALEAIHRHIRPGGRLVLDLVDSHIDILSEKLVPPRSRTAIDEPSGRRFVRRLLNTHYDLFAQIQRDVWRFSEVGDKGETLREETRDLVLRWTYRWELRHLLARCAFSVEAEYSDYLYSPPTYGKELLVVARVG
ncbi:class I SAM-dependent methyltransferase [bacterium M00.F.Ca.ET.152.01.1.1]|nr:class I SAM-dependent methyltransferase [bacterium M00.F.Ca.ET.152.01.1.1]